MGQFFYIISSVTALYLGFSSANHLQLLFLVPFGFVVGYIFIRLPQIYGLWKKDGIKIVTAFLFQYVIYLVLSFLLYGIGLGVSHMIN